MSEPTGWADALWIIPALEARTPAMELTVPTFESDQDDPNGGQVVHQPTGESKVTIWVAPDMDILGRSQWVREGQWYIALREWNPQVLLHELLHVVLDKHLPRIQYDYSVNPLQHKVINAVEVALAAWFTPPVPELTPPCICGDGDGVGFCFGVRTYSDECAACLALDPGAPCLASGAKGAS